MTVHNEEMVGQQNVFNVMCLVAKLQPEPEPIEMQQRELDRPVIHPLDLMVCSEDHFLSSDLDSTHCIFL